MPKGVMPRSPPLAMLTVMPIKPVPAAAPFSGRIVMTHSTNAERTAKAKQLIEARNAAPAVRDGDLLINRIKQIARRRRFAMKI